MAVALAGAAAWRISHKAPVAIEILNLTDLPVAEVRVEVGDAVSQVGEIPPWAGSDALLSPRAPGSVVVRYRIGGHARAVELCTWDAGELTARFEVHGDAEDAFYIDFSD